MKSSNSLLLAGDTLWKCDWGLDNGRRTWILGYGQLWETSLGAPKVLKAIKLSP